MFRLFTGLSIPRTVAARMALLTGGIPGARWHDQDNYHVTLTYIGAADDVMAEDIDAALMGVTGTEFDIALSGAGMFDKGGIPTVLWLGVKQNDILEQLKQKIDHALLKQKISFTAQKYIPHMTLAYLQNAERAKVAEFVVDHNLFKTAPFPVISFHLYNSIETKNGRRYEVLQSYPLG